MASIRNSRKRARDAQACEKEAEEYRLQTNDLVQQSRAANAAQAQAEIASQSLWTGFLQTLGGMLTLVAAVGAAFYAREAARETRRQANLAEEQLGHTFHMVRPYLAPKSETVELHPDEVQQLVIWLRFTNSGGTAAHGLIFYATSIFRTYGVAKTTNLHPGRWPHGSVGREQPVEIEYKLQLAAEDLQSLQSGTGEVRIIFEGTYSNEFGEDWEYRTDLSITKASIDNGVIYTNDLQQHRAVKKEEPEPASHQPTLDLKGGG
ncbi:MAG: hypothetical protein ACJ8FR_10440 [Sphingomonas sp.]